jgi:hypothetical protein
MQACRRAGVQRGCRDRDMQSKTPTLRQLTTRCCRCCSGAARGNGSEDAAEEGQAQATDEDGGERAAGVAMSRN